MAVGTLLVCITLLRYSCKYRKCARDRNYREFIVHIEAILRHLKFVFKYFYICNSIPLLTKIMQTNKNNLQALGRNPSRMMSRNWFQIVALCFLMWVIFHRCTWDNIRISWIVALHLFGEHDNLQRFLLNLNYSLIVWICLKQETK